MVKLRDRSGNF